MNFQKISCQVFVPTCVPTCTKWFHFFRDDIQFELVFVKVTCSIPDAWLNTFFFLAIPISCHHSYWLIIQCYDCVDVQRIHFISNARAHTHTHAHTHTNKHSRISTHKHTHLFLHVVTRIFNYIWTNWSRYHWTKKLFDHSNAKVFAYSTPTPKHYR